MEIEAVLKAARQATRGRVIVVHQPHRYSRLSLLFDDFCQCFNEADIVAITEIYSGRTPYGRPWDLISALAMIIITPLIAIIFFTNKTIIGGLTSGSIK